MTKGDTGARGEKGDQGEKGPEGRRARNVTLSWWTLVIVAVIAIGLVTWDQNKTRGVAARADRVGRTNARLLREFEAFRAARSRQTTAADLKLCRAINTITKRDRATFLASGRGTADLLRIVGVPEAKIAEVVAAQKANRVKELARRPLVQCEHLPTSGTATAPPKLP